MYDRLELFRTYVRNASEKSTFVEKFADRVKSAKRPIRSILDVGCHDGTLALRYLAAIEPECVPDFQFLGVEPSRAALENFCAQSLATPWAKKIELLASTVEGYLGCPIQTDSASATVPTFDWAVVSHCLYWTIDLPGVLDGLLSRARDAVIVLRGRRGIFEIQSAFEELIGNKDEQLYCADDLETALQQCGAGFQREDIETSIVLPDSEVHREWLMSFFLQTQPEEIRTEDMAKVCAFTNQLAGGENAIPHDVSFFWVSKR